MTHLCLGKNFLANSLVGIIFRVQPGSYHVNVSFFLS